MPIPLALIPTIASQLPTVGKWIGGLFGGNEDASDTGFRNFSTSLTKFPTKEYVLAAAQAGGWNNEIGAISSSYNSQDGTWKRGDWNFKITSNNPITARAFKGANESFAYSSNVSYPVGSQAVNTGNNFNGIPNNLVPTDGRPASWSEAEVKVGWLPIVLIAVVFLFGKKFLR